MTRSVAIVRLWKAFFLVFPSLTVSREARNNDYYRCHDFEARNQALRPSPGCIDISHPCPFALRITFAAHLTHGKT